VGLETRLVARTARPDPEFGQVEAIADLAAILPGSAFVILVLPATSESRGTFGAAQLGAMDQDAVLVNIGRGAVLDEAALVEALRAGRLGWAAIDVFTAEPLPPDDPLWRVPGLLVSPHMAGDFAGFEDALMTLFRAQLETWLADRPLQNVVDKQRGYVTTA
jgi:phosphoglycerate dehydrogenase-like enzyme